MCYEAERWGKPRLYKRKSLRAAAIETLIGWTVKFSNLSDHFNKTQAHGMLQAKTFIKPQFMKHWGSF